MLRSGRERKLRYVNIEDIGLSDYGISGMVLLKKTFEIYKLTDLKLTQERVDFLYDYLKAYECN